MTSLSVEFAGEVWNAEHRLSFGRAADIELDSNTHLHRLVGEFAEADGSWWIHNLGTRLFLTVVSDDGTRTDLAPGGQQLLVGRSGSVRVVAGPARYEMSYELLGGAAPVVVSRPKATGETTEYQAILTPREVDFLVAFARPLLDGTNDPLPTYADVAKLWSVSPKTLDNTLQSVRRKLKNARLVRSEPLDALIRVVISHSLVTAADLEWADLDSDSPRPSASVPTTFEGPAERAD